jgi:O-antigen/teichoic acid export membrane protein
VFDRLKNLFRNLAIYGLGDVATSFVSLLLLPIYTRYLTPADYGIIAMLLTVEAAVKVVFRWGVDTAFMRLYYDCKDQASRQRLASTIFFFLLVVNGILLMLVIPTAGWMSRMLFGTPQHGRLIVLVIANMFVANLFFIPFQVLRIGEKSGQFVSLVFTRSAATLIMRLVLVIWAGLGVLGIVAADVVVTAAFSVVLSRWFVPLIRPMFSRAIIRDALEFGLPRIPHSVAQQIISVADRYLLNAYGTLRDVGLYSIGASFGLALKLFLSAFEYAWTPFFLGVMSEPDAPRTYSSVSTYILAVLVLLAGGLCSVAADIVRLSTTSQFHDAARVTPWIALGVMFQGVYLVGSIGLVITKRTTRYPIATGIAAGASLLANWLLIPRFGVLGAAWANTIAYATLALVTVGFSLHLYPIPYEWSRLFRVSVAGVAAYIASDLLVPHVRVAVFSLLLHGTVMVVAYVGSLFVTGFFHAGEIGALRQVWQRVLERRGLRARPPDPSQVEMAGEIVATPSEPAGDALGASTGAGAGSADVSEPPLADGPAAAARTQRLR